MALSPWKSLLNTAQIKNDYTSPPAGLKWRSNTLFILSTVAIGLFTDLFLYSLVVPVIPFLLEDRIGIPDSQVQSYTSALLAVLAGSSVVFSPVAGILADRVSTRQAPFLLGLSTLIGATVLLFLGTTVPAIVIARVLQGISSAFVWTVGLAICIETVGPENLGKVVGSMFSFIGVGSLWAPFVGGLLYEKQGYIGVLALALAVLGVDLIMRIFMIEKKVARRYEHEVSDTETNHAEANNGSAEQTAINDERQPLLGPQQQPEEDLSEFVLSEHQSKTRRILPILPCLTHPGLLTALLLAVIQAMLLGSLDATITTVSRDLFSFTPLRAGIMFLPIGITDLIFGPITGWCVDKYGTKPVAVFSFGFLAPVLVLFRLPHEGGMDQILLYAGLLALAGVGLAGIAAPSIVEAGSVVDKFHKANPKFFGENGPYAQLYGMNSALFNLGLTVGPELAGELKKKIGYGNMNLVLAVICAGTAGVSWLYMGGKPGVLRRRERKDTDL